METARGIPLARAYWREVVRPLLDDFCPRLPRAAARIGSGSDVLGLDDEMSRDHDWGLRLQLFVPADARHGVTRLLEEQLPETYDGHPTRITFTGQAEDALAVDVLDLDDSVHAQIGFDPRHDATPTDWLSLTGQAVLELTAGEVFEDPAGGLTSIREALRWYPDDAWRYVLACDWQRLDQELPLMQRAGHRGDDLGSRVIAARLVDTSVHLGFLLSRRWAPYAKWRGSLFRELPLPSEVSVTLAATLAAADWRRRADQLTRAVNTLAAHQQALGLPAAAPACVPFWDRGYVHIDQGLISPLLDSITDPRFRRLPRGLGSIEQRTDNVDLLVDPARRRAAVAASLR